jgi:transposase
MPAGPGPIHAGAPASVRFCQYILQHGFVEAEIGNQLLQPEILFLRLPHVLQLRRGNPAVFFAPGNGMDYLLPLRLTVRNMFSRRITMNIVFLGIDLAKDVFQLCGLNQAGKPVYTKRTGRKELLQTVANIPACLIAIEASTGAFYWQREFEKLGHNVKVISPQYVKPFVRGQKMTAMTPRR